MNDADHRRATDRVEEASPRRAGPKRILLTTLGSLGDLNPFLAIAHGLKARGHDPVVATSPSYRVLVETRGLRFHPVRPDLPDPASDPDLMRRVMDRRSGLEEVLRGVMASLADSFDDLSVAAADADLVVSQLLTFAAPLVAEARGLPWASTALQPVAFFSTTDPPALGLAPWLERSPLLGPRLWALIRRLVVRRAAPLFAPWRDLRARLGLPPQAPIPLLDGHSPELVLALFSPLFASPQPDWPRRVVQTGFPFLEPPGAGRVPPPLEAFLAAGPPPVVFTLGSSAVQAAGGFYAASAEAARNLGVRAVLLVGRDRRNLVGDLPAGVIAVDAAPYAALFPRSAAIVQSGGIGTTAEALRAGRPSLVVPFGHDQPDNARRIERLGTGRSLSPARYTAVRAAGELRALLDDPTYARNATAVGARVRGEDGVGEACAALEQMLR